MNTKDIKFYIIEKITCYTEEEGNKRDEVINEIEELIKYKKMWWAFYDKHDDECWNVPDSMSETREKFFPEEE